MKNIGFIFALLLCAAFCRAQNPFHPVVPKPIDQKPVMGIMDDLTPRGDAGIGYLMNPLRFDSVAPTYDRGIVYAVKWPNTGAQAIVFNPSAEQGFIFVPHAKEGVIFKAGNANFKAQIGDGYLAEFSGKAITNRPYDTMKLMEGIALFYWKESLVAMWDPESEQISVFDNRYPDGYFIYCNWLTQPSVYGNAN